jgi:hypothetical protein
MRGSKVKANLISVVMIFGLRSNDNALPLLFVDVRAEKSIVKLASTSLLAFPFQRLAWLVDDDSYIVPT